MPFSRYQIRNEFSLADPELYKAADKDDPEALLEGVAMAGLVGVLRQLGDLAEFAAEVFHGLHEEVMATAARGHGLLTRVQQVESDFPLIERAFLSQTCHSAFFSSPGINWHPNLQTEQNLITKGDLPRFVMDSYEECRGPPRLFLLDKFDVAGAGACLKRYTDPSFYKVEVSSYEMMTAEAQRDKKTRKTKKKGARWKNGDTHTAFEPSHVKLHQLLLEERMQNGASEPTRRVRIKKREIKFPFDTETGKGYMEKLLDSPPEDKLVHEVKVVDATIHLPTDSYDEPELVTVEDKMVNSPLDEIEEKHISVVEENKEDGTEDGCQSDDVASETDNYMDALATMESEAEPDVESRAASSDPVIKQESFSNSNLEKLQESRISDDEGSPIKNQLTTFSYSVSDSDSATASANNVSPRGVNSPHSFASTEIPFRPRVFSTQVTDNPVEVSENAVVLVDQETIFKETDSKESDSSEMSSNNLVDVNITKVEIENDPQNEDKDSNSTPVNSLVEEQSLDPARDKLSICEDDVLESKYDSSEAGLSYSNEDETVKGEETVSVDSESHNTNTVAHHDFESNELEELSTTGEPGENKLVVNGSGCVHDSDVSVENKSIEESVIPPELDSIPSTELIESDEKKESSEESVILQELNSITSASYDHSNSRYLDDIVDGNEHDIDNPGKELLESGEMEESSVEPVISAESDSMPFSYNDHSDIQFLDSIHKNRNENDADRWEKESIESGEQRESREESFSIPSAYNGHPHIHVGNIHKNGNERDADDTEKESSEESVMESDSIPSAYHDEPNIQLLDAIHKDGADSEEKESNDSGEKKESIEDAVVSQESDSIPSAYHDHPNTQFLDVAQNNRNESDIGSPATESIESGEKKESSEESVIPPESDYIPSASYYNLSNVQDETVFVNEKTDQNGLQNVTPDVDILPPNFAESAESVNQDGQTSKLKATHTEEKADELEILESQNPANQDPVNPPSMVDLSKLLPELAPVNMEEMPPLPPLPPVQWLMGKFQSPSLIPIPGGGHAGVTHFPPVSPQIESQSEITRTDQSEPDHETNKVKISEELDSQPPINTEESQIDSVTEPEIIRLSTASSLPLVDNEMPNGIRPMKIQRPRTPLIDAVEAHDKNKLRKVAERAVPLFPKEEEKDTFLEQIRAKSFNLKPAVPTRPIIQGPTTNLRVAAILEKANAIRQAFAGSDDDEDDNDSWSDS